MARVISVRPADLRIDEENARIAKPNEGQNSALKALAGLLQAKLLRLARDIVQHGINPSDLPIVMQAAEEPGRYIVLEGNRRVAALRALENPEWLVGAVDAPIVTAMRKLSKEYHLNPIETVECVVFADRDEPRHWIELRHTGENAGAGLVPWGSDEKSRYRARTGKAELHLQALNFLEEAGYLAPEVRAKVPATSFRRLLGTPVVRERLAIDFADGQLKLNGAEVATAKAMMFIINDLTGPPGKKTNVTKIYTQAQRVAYALKIPKVQHLASKPTTKGSPALSPEEKKKARRRRKPARPRDRLIPPDCTMEITNAKLAAIEEELRQLSLDNHTHAVSVLFRVFIELSADEYIAKHKLAAKSEDQLSHKLSTSLKDLLTKKKLTQEQAVPVRQACQKGSMFAPSITLMHKYIHNQFIFPTPTDLRHSWNNLQPFLVAMWT